MKLGGTAEVKLLLSYRKIGQDFLRDKQRRIDPRASAYAAEAMPKTQPIYK